MENFYSKLTNHDEEWDFFLKNVLKNFLRLFYKNENILKITDPFDLWVATFVLFSHIPQDAPFRR